MPAVFAMPADTAEIRAIAFVDCLSAMYLLNQTDEDVFDAYTTAATANVLPYNSLHRQFEPALQMLDESIKVYQGKA